MRYRDTGDYQQLGVGLIFASLSYFVMRWLGYL